MRVESTSDWFLKLLDHHNFIPVAGMVVGVIAMITAATVIITMSRLWLTHRQRMAMIRAGMHPDTGLHADEMLGDEQGALPAPDEVEKRV